VAGCLLEAGARVVVASRTRADLDETVELLGPSGEVAAMPCDVSDRAAVDGLVEGVVARFGGLDVLVCCHGVYRPVAFVDLDDETWGETIAINLGGMFYTGRAAARVMIGQGRGGRIVNITSINGLAAEPECAHYNASKGAAHALTQSMAFELGAHGITVNAVAPGWVKSPLSAPFLTEQILSGEQAINPMRRVGEPEDIGAAVVWLADPAASYVNGAVIVVDGGQTAMLPMPIDTSV
jgi:NAD(P)-dependent dehydrogenase (short-subunit alcohol dehydrogenase family)